MQVRNAQVRAAITTGRKEAQEILADRRKALKKRAAAIATASERPRRSAAVKPISARQLGAAGGPGSAGTLVAEGDSWFDYPRTDVLGKLEDEHGYDVEKCSHAGDRVESMAYDGGQLLEFTRLLEKVIRRGIRPAAILLSGGGNDVAGDEFEMLLDHARSPRPGLNDAVVNGVLEQRVLLSYVTLISAVTKVCNDLLGGPVRILVHGYDRPVPDGRGFMGGWWFLPGPWLEPGFRIKGYDAIPERVRIAGQLIDRFNAMMSGIPSVTGFAHVRYIDLRGTLTNAAGYKKDWANELHPTPQGYARVASRFAAAIVAP